MSLTDEQRATAEQALGYNFQNVALLKESLTHASIADNRLLSNERMEFLGDAVLDLIVCEDIYKRFPTFAEGELTKIKSAVVSRKTCTDIAREMKLDKLLILGKGITSRQQIPPSLSAAVYESVVAAIYLDGGFEAAREFVLRTVVPKIISISANIHQHNYKAMLQQHAQGRLSGTPLYELLDEKGPDHSKCFEVCVTVNGRRFESAWGTNKKIAEQKAALMALRELGVLGDEETEEAIETVNATEPEFID
ncbi:MAG TPA: ribonuclease III [Tepidisphaeraceae bacterium]|nr:ribonuclease III [Tepidisphaeraceae bacterium]